MLIWTATSTTRGIPSQVDAYLQVLAQREGLTCERMATRDAVVEALTERTPDCLVIHHHLCAEEGSPDTDPWVFLAKIPATVRVVYLFFEQDLPLIEESLRRFAIKAWIIGTVDPETLRRKVLAPGSDEEPELLFNQSPAFSLPAPAAVRKEPEVRVETRVETRVERVVETRVLSQKLVLFWTPGRADCAALCAHVAGYLAQDPALNVIAADLNLWSPQVAIHLGIAQQTEDPVELCFSRAAVSQPGASRKQLVKAALRPSPLRKNLLAFSGFWDLQASLKVDPQQIRDLIGALQDVGQVLCLTVASPLADTPTREALQAADQVIVPVGSAFGERLHVMRHLLELGPLGLPLERVTLVPWGASDRKALADEFQVPVTAPVPEPDPEWVPGEVLEALLEPPRRGALAAYCTGIQAVAEAVCSTVSVQRRPIWRRWLGR